MYRITRSLRTFTKPGQLTQLRANIQTRTMVSDADAKQFFSSPEFAVVGASSNPAKFGHKSLSSPSRDTHQSMLYDPVVH